jgi:hypothetical protein
MVARVDMRTDRNPDALSPSENDAGGVAGSESLFVFAAR